MPNSSTHLFLQEWTKKSERIKSTTPLPEDPITPELEELLVPAPYKASKKKAKNKGKGAKDGPHHKGPPEAVSGEIEPVSSHEEYKDEEEEEEEEEEVESDSPLKTRRGKRTASENLEGATPKRGRVVLSDSLDSESEHNPKSVHRDKPLAVT